MEQSRWLGGVGVFTNDYLGDGHDRWRTGSFMRSEMMRTRHGPVEFRLRAEMIAPRHIGRPPSPEERDYVGLLAPGALLHLDFGEVTFQLGGELAIVGPQTGMATLMERSHDLVGFQSPIATEGQVGNAIHPAFLSEMEWRLMKGRIRPFAAIHLGPEDQIRAGFDVLITDIPDALYVREPVTGHRIAILRGEQKVRPTISLGADLTRVFDTVYLADETTEDWRFRARGGIDAQVFGVDVFAGIAFLGPEYDLQDEGQLVGSIGAFLRF